MQKVTVFTKSACVQCDQTKKRMKDRGVEFEEVDLEANPEILEKFKKDGLLQAPIVVIGNDGRRWSGFRPDLIAELQPRPDENAA